MSILYLTNHDTNTYKLSIEIRRDAVADALYFAASASVLNVIFLWWMV